jgi:N-acetylglutamate synthase-like GNAT family acetyltransferase
MNSSTSDKSRIFVRNARDQDIPTVAQIDAEAFPGAAEKLETFQRRLRAFPDGFPIMVAGNEIAGYGCSEKWLEQHEQGQDENPLASHQPEGRIFCITALAVKKSDRGKGYGLLILDKLIEMARAEGCRKMIVETTQAQGLFSKRGFETVQHRTERGTTVDVMSLELQSVAMHHS